MATSPHPTLLGFIISKIFKNISEEANAILISYGILDNFLFKKNRVQIEHLELQILYHN